jgi:methyl-accepting chemotaxis protein
LKSVRIKLVGSFLIIMVFVFVLAFSGLSQIKKMSNFTDEVSSKWMSGVATIYEISLKKEQFLNAYYQTMIEKDAEKLQKLNDSVAAAVQAIDGEINNYKDTATTDADKQSYIDLKDSWSRFIGSFGVANSATATKEQKAEALQIVSAAFADFNVAVEALIAYNQNGAAHIELESEELYLSTSSAIFYIGVFILLIVIGLAWLLVVNLTRPLRATTALMNRISAGDLTVAPLVVRRKDEFGIMMTAVNQTLANLQSSVKQMQGASTSVATASVQLFASSEQNSEAAKHVAESIQQVAVGSEEQAHTAIQVGRVIDEMAEGVQKIAESTGEVSDLSQQAAQRANDGSVKIIEVSGKMQKLYESVELASQTIHKLEVQSQQIGEISTLIGDIAYRTNLLALNAAIEAARAGEHGKGFAVVAGEVRKLASQSDESSRGIIELIASIQLDTSTAAETMNKSLVEVQESVLVVEDAEQSFKEILTSTLEVSSRVQDAAAAAEQLAASSEEVAASIANMGHIAKQTADRSQQVAASTEEQIASSEEMTSSSQTLSGIAKDLQVIVRKFNL